MISLYRFQQAHTNSCEFVKLPCVHPECDMLVRQADLPQHLETECKCRPKTCGFCKKQISLNKLKVWGLVLFIVLKKYAVSDVHCNFKYANVPLFWVNCDFSGYFSHFQTGVSTCTWTLIFSNLTEIHVPEKSRLLFGVDNFFWYCSVIKNL